MAEPAATRSRSPRRSPRRSTAPSYVGPSFSSAPSHVGPSFSSATRKPKATLELMEGHGERQAHHEVHEVHEGAMSVAMPMRKSRSEKGSAVRVSLFPSRFAHRHERPSAAGRLCRPATLIALLFLHDLHGLQGAFALGLLRELRG